MEKGVGLFVCHECDLLQRIAAVPEGATARCGRCGALLWKHTRNSIDRTLALSVTALVLFGIANAFPFLALKSGSIVQQTTLLSGVRGLQAQGYWLLAGVVLLTSVLFPLAQILVTIYLLLPLRVGRRPWQFRRFFRLLSWFEPWSMMEVFMVGILVSVVKLAKMASVVPGLSLYAFAALIFVLAAAMSSIDPHQVWEEAEKGEGC